MISYTYESLGYGMRSALLYYMKTYNELVSAVQTIVPQACFETDNEGQCIVYTGVFEKDFGSEGFRYDNELVLSTKRIIPFASFELDNDGQLMIYTNLTEKDDGTLVEFSDDSES